ncbi:MAG: motility protein A [Oscillospiraceae bacterium]
MDISNIIGYVMGFGLIAFGIMQGGEFGNFVDPASVAITIGGTFSALFISFPLNTFLRIPKHLKIVMFPPKNDPYAYISRITDLAQEARKKGLLALEEKASESGDPFLENSVMLIVDGMEPSKVKQIMESELENLSDRHSVDRSFYEKGAALGPAFGMIGTLIGLINMLYTMDENPDKLALGMAVALITTFYGSVLANMIFQPIANKLQIRHDDEMLCKMIVCEGIISIQAGENPRHIEDKLLNFLPQKKRKVHKDKSQSEQ